MPKLNENYLNVQDSYLFAEIARRVKVYEENHPDKAGSIIRLGIGDVTRPLTKSAVEGLHKAVDEQTVSETFKGYGPEQGYEFARKAVADYYARNGVSVDADDVFISDGAKSDTGNITELFAQDNVILVPDPVYPVYVDTNTMDGKKIIYMNGTEENDFLPMPDNNVKADIIYLCSPNNPTGACYNKEQLKAWVDYALANEAVILFDSAYEAFVSEPELPRSIYAVEGAKKCAIEFCSLSKTAGFTGTRCGYTVIPKELEREGMNLNAMWVRNRTTKTNGVSYILQKGAAAVFTDEGQKQIKANIAVYKRNAKLHTDALDKLGIWYCGGKNAPYVWMKCPKGMSSWEFFDFLLEKAQIVGTPGEGFGSCGEGYFRFSTFGSPEDTAIAAEKLVKLLSE